mmetsp:Transcript_110518/g.307872  ORF Transcript_110518/g.307872 Transcript_110518/m.307872 type:complete len:338 (-) Transcript_110518:40-1053(-)
MLGDTGDASAHGARAVRAVPVVVCSAAAVCRRALLRRAQRGVQRRDGAPPEVRVRRPDARVEDVYVDIGAAAALPRVGVAERHVALIDAVESPGGRRLLGPVGRVRPGPQRLRHACARTPHVLLQGEDVLVRLCVFDAGGARLRDQPLEVSGRGAERDDGQPAVGGVAREAHLARGRHPFGEAAEFLIGPACWHLEDPVALRVQSPSHDALREDGHTGYGGLDTQLAPQRRVPAQRGLRGIARRAGGSGRPRRATCLQGAERAARGGGRGPGPGGGALVRSRQRRGHSFRIARSGGGRQRLAGASRWRRSREPEAAEATETSVCPEGRHWKHHREGG